jgi:hypothetical protein
MHGYAARMVIIQTSNGMTGEYRLQPSDRGLRLGRCVSFDLRTMVMDAGWCIQAVKTARARKRLRWAGLAILPQCGHAPGAQPTAA